MRSPSLSFLFLGAHLVSSASASHPHGAAAPLSRKTVKLLKNRLALNSFDVWVSGTRVEALLEVDYPALSVLSAPYVPVPSHPIPAETNKIIASWAAQRGEGCKQFYCAAGGAAADPASLGVGWVLAARKNASLMQALDEEVEYLLDDVKRFPDGTMSMRQEDEDVSLWADFVYMVPPFLAYDGILNHDEAILDEAFKQIELYRKYLKDDKTDLWRHIYNWIYNNDQGLWATGKCNGWAAAGMLRVAATVHKSVYRVKYAHQVKERVSWIDGILVGAFARIGDDDLLPNYLDRAANATFSDTASSALLASVSFRLSALGLKQTSSNIAIAKRLRVAVNKGIDPTTGWIAPAVNPVGWEKNSGESPEGVAFALLLDAAYRAYLAKA